MLNTNNKLDSFINSILKTRKDKPQTNEVTCIINNIPLELAAQAFTYIANAAPINTLQELEQKKLLTFFYDVVFSFSPKKFIELFEKATSNFKNPEAVKFKKLCDQHNVRFFDGVPSINFENYYPKNEIQFEPNEFLKTKEQNLLFGLAKSFVYATSLFYQPSQKDDLELSRKKLRNYFDNIIKNLIHYSKPIIVNPLLDHTKQNHQILLDKQQQALTDFASQHQDPNIFVLKGPLNYWQYFFARNVPALWVFSSLNSSYVYDENNNEQTPWFDSQVACIAKSILKDNTKIKKQECVIDNKKQVRYFLPQTDVKNALFNFDVKPNLIRLGQRHVEPWLININKQIENGEFDTNFTNSKKIPNNRKVIPVKIATKTFKL